MKKWLRYTVRIAGGILFLLILTWLALAGYVSVKKDSLLQKARTEIKNRFGGDARVGDWEISLFRHFPSITLHLSGVSLRDSLWQQHHHDLLQAQSVDVSLALFKSLLAGKVRIGKLTFRQGLVYFYTDSTGYSNKYLLRQRPSATPSSAKNEKEADPPEIILSDIKWVEERQDKHKLFDIDIHHLTCDIKRNGRTLSLGVDANLRIHSLSFNTEKGSFVKDKALTGHFSLQFNTGSKILQFHRAAVVIDGHPFFLSGRFFPSVNPDPFFLDIETTNIPFRKLSALLTPHLQQKLDEYDIDRPVSVQAVLDAGSADDRTPLINVRMNLSAASILTPAGRFNSASFRGSFTNEWIHSRPRGDDNSGIRLLGFTGEKDKIGLRSDTLTITDLQHPVLACDIHSRFDLTRLNDLSGSQTLQFQKGVCSANLRYKGPLSENDSSSTSIKGALDLDSAAVAYLPYQLLLKNGNGTLLFSNQDLVIDHLEGQLGNTKIRVRGIAKNLVALLDRNAQDVTMDWNLSSPRLDLRDFTTLAGRPVESPSKTGAAPKKNNQVVFGAVFGRIDRFLKEGDIHLKMEAADLRYKNFTGAHAKADLLFSSREIRLMNMEVQQGSGSLALKATLTRSDAGASNTGVPNAGGSNPVSLESHLDRVDLPRLFAAFNDFGQNALLASNLKGSLTADIRMTGRLSNKAEMMPGSLKGRVNFAISNGQLLNFEPMEKVHETVLKKRDLSEIRFAEMGSQLDLDTTTITIHRMEIQSTALTVFVEGTYDWKKGPDLSLQVPLSNLKERNPAIPPAKKGNDGSTGLSVRLRARTGHDGKLKITWDPFKKALKKKH